MSHVCILNGALGILHRDVALRTNYREVKKSMWPSKKFGAFVQKIF